MRIKAKEIAQEMGISPATVSLALNDRPGISAATKKRILDYIRDREAQQYRLQELTASSCGCVLIASYIKNGIIMERSIMPENFVFPKMEEAVLQAGYHFKSMVYQERIHRMDDFLRQCRAWDTRGIYLMAAEMQQGDIYPFLDLNIPIVTGDNLFYDAGLDSFLIDNREGISRCVDYLVEKGHSHIVYLAENISIFNFDERREAFILEMAKKQCGDASNRIRYMGSSVEEVYASMCRYLDEGLKDTTAFVLESSVVSLGVGKALLERHMRIPRDISLIGFDALPPVSLPGLNLTLIKGTHTKRHMAAIEHLIRHIEGDDEEIMRVYYKTRLLEGDSVFDKAKYIYR
ncbi:MAG: LacI family transcriptional regulator [Eubacterium sp.]|nr:LacI family transcriptional regulator [Eubacterium sp.]